MGQFDNAMHDGRDCAVWEAMCPEAADGTLTAAEQRAFDHHISQCAHCAAELAEARRGAAWLHMLKGHAPEPPAGLLERILAETTGVGEAVDASTPAFAVPVMPAWPQPLPPATPNRWQLLWARTVTALGLDGGTSLLQPRMAMTVATAFFSCALSLNLLGLHLRDFASLRPGAISRTVADVSASATRKFENLRVVYQLESRVDALTSDASAADPMPSENRQPAAAQPGHSAPAKPEPQSPARPQGSSDLLIPRSPGMHTATRVLREG